MANQRAQELSPSLQADEKGCFRQVVKTKVFQPRQKGYDMKIEVEAKIKEDGTGLYYRVNRRRLSGSLPNFRSALNTLWFLRLMKVAGRQSQEIKHFRTEGVRVCQCACVQL